MKTKKTNLRYLLLGMAIAFATYLAMDWEDFMRGITDGYTGRSYNYEEQK